MTESCRTQISIMLDAADDTRIIILRVDEPGDSLIQLAQYQLHSISALEQKLAQFPRGASFTLHVRALDAEIGAAVVSKILAFADTHGIAVKQEP